MMAMTIVPPEISIQKSTSCFKMPARITPPNTSLAMSIKNLFACANNSYLSFLVIFLAIFAFSFCKGTNIFVNNQIIWGKCFW